MKLMQNFKTLLTNPGVAWDYFNYQLSKQKNSGQVIRRFPGGIKISGFSGFSEFHSCQEFISLQERKFLHNHSFGVGDLIDVGANLGVFSLTLAQRFSDKKIHAFEPNPSTFKACQSNILLNNYTNIQTQSLAVANYNGEITFEANPTDRGTTSISKVDSKHTIKVPCITLDTYAEKESIEEIALLKVDVEGYEELVFQGAKKLLSQRKIAVIYYEVCPNNAINTQLKPEDATKLLLSHGYKIYRFTSGGTLSQASVYDLRKVVLDNWVAICR